MDYLVTQLVTCPGPVLTENLHSSQGQLLVVCFLTVMIWYFKQGYSQHHRSESHFSWVCINCATGPHRAEVHRAEVPHFLHPLNCTLNTHASGLLHLLCGNHGLLVRKYQSFSNMGVGATFPSNYLQEKQSEFKQPDSSAVTLYWFSFFFSLGIWIFRKVKLITLTIFLWVPFEFA